MTDHTIEEQLDAEVEDRYELSAEDAERSKRDEEQTIHIPASERQRHDVRITVYDGRGFGHRLDMDVLERGDKWHATNVHLTPEQACRLSYLLRAAAGVTD